jgi:hypothetical protein
VRGNLKDLKIQTEIPDFEIPVSRNIPTKDYQYLLQKAKDKNYINKQEGFSQKQ